MTDPSLRPCRSRTRAALLGLLTAAALLGPGVALAPVAVAGPCQPVCPEPGPGPDDPQPHPPVVKNRVTITRVDVVETQDLGVPDGVQLKIADNWAFHADMGAGTSAFPNASRDLLANSGTYAGAISAWETDTWPNPNDFVGDVALIATSSSQVQTRVADLRGSSAHYRVTYTFKRIT